MINPTDAEQETRLQFLEEARECLRAIEDLLLELPQETLDRGKLDGALRAAHSIKGGAGIMGYHTLSHIAHRLEDVFKLIKVRRPTLSAAVVSLLLSSVDGMHHLIALGRKGVEADETWITNTAEPVFSQLKEHLGELQPGEEEQLLQQDSGQDVAAILFDSEVEACLNRLEQLLDDPQPLSLETDLTQLAQDLAGLGEMLELENFRAICQDIEAQIQAYPEQIVEIAHAALKDWQRCQALVIVGEKESLPDCFSWSPSSKPLDSFLGDEDSASDPSLLLEGIDLSHLDWLNDTIQTDFEDETYEQLQSEPQSQFDDPERGDAAPAPLFGDVDLLNQLELLDDVILAESEDDLYEEQGRAGWGSDLESSDPSHAVSEFRDIETAPLILEAQPIQPQPQPVEDEVEARSVRVPLRRLEQLNDFCGELTIGSTGLDLKLNRLRTLMGTLVRRVQNLDQSNQVLRGAYDRVATQVLGNFQIMGLELDKLRPEGFDVLELDRYSELHPVWQEVMETVVWLQEVAGDMDLLLRDAERTAFDFTRVSKQMQISVTQTRMRPFSDLVERFPRAIRDMSVQFGKPVNLSVRGGATLIDRTVMEKLIDPLTHLIRNAFDHGIEDPETRQHLGKPEQGMIQIEAGYRGNQIIISISDDGGGIDFEKVRAKAERFGIETSLLEQATERELIELIFEPGFSTSQSVTSLSGRGVGMDIVKTNLDEIGGTIQVQTQKGKGTHFTLSVPFMPSVMRVLLVESCNMLMAFPTDTVEQMVLVQADDFIQTSNRQALHWEGHIVPKVNLEDWLEFRCPTRLIELDAVSLMSAPAVLVLSQGNDLVCVPIKQCWGEREVAVRAVEPSLPLPKGFSSCTILGDGQVVPIVHVPHMFEWAMDSPGSREPLKLDTVPTTDPPMVGHRQSVLVVDDSINVRRYLALALEKVGYQVEQAKDGQDAFEKLSKGLDVDAVVCDIEMPRLDGFGFLAQFQKLEQAKDIPVVMLTSRTASKHRKLALALGAADYFTKPYQEKALVERIKELIEARQTVTV